MQKLHKKFTNSVISDKTESEIEDTERTRMVSYFYSYLHMCIGVQTHYVYVLYWDCFIGLSHMQWTRTNGVSHLLVDKE